MILPGKKHFFIFFDCQLLAERYADYVSDEFQEHGLYLFCGEQGSGKTYSMTYNK